MSKPYSESCDQNRDVILEVISPLLSSASDVFEIGSGTGQHAVYFSEMMPHLNWHTSDRVEYLEGIRQWIKYSGLDNVTEPVELDVSASVWPKAEFDAIFTANSVHIMNQRDVDNLVAGVARLLKPGGCFLIYGPFNYDGQYTSDSNVRFDGWLKQRDPHSGIKDFESILSQAEHHGMSLMKDYTMPANNRILHFAKK